MKSILATISFALIILFLAPGCKTAAPTVKTLAEYKGRLVEYGSQGGITGGGTTISLLENGQIFSTTTLPQAENYHGQVDSKDAKALIDEAMALVEKHGDLSGKGNMTYYLIYNDGTTPKKITWAAEVFPPEDIKAFTQKLNEFTQSKTK